MQQLIAHLKKNEDGSYKPPHKLLEHLRGTSEFAEEFAAAFDSRAWGKIVGLAHDAGKARDEWQEYLIMAAESEENRHLENSLHKVPHAAYGAVLVEKLFGNFGRLLSYPIAGHHAGLPDWDNAEASGKSSLKSQMRQYENTCEIPSEISDMISNTRGLIPPCKFDNNSLDMSLWIRMLFSCLVDADFLDTERYMAPDRFAERSGYLKITELLEKYYEHIKELDENAPDININQIRRDIRTKCVLAANKSQGIFSLSVPTGGGKTLSSLAFALEHAKKHSLKRIIYVIPYTSIIEQTSDVFQNVFGGEQVVEHHSNLEQEEVTNKSRLSAENWDAPIIVTTSVQFFESLFSSKSSRCRKLHNVAESVVVLDEAQLVPAEFLNPILETLQLLVKRYKVSLLISTATQPAFGENEKSENKVQRLTGISEIIGNEDDVNALYNSLIRTQVEFPSDLNQPIELEMLAKELSGYYQVLCIVSDRKSCLELYELMPEGTYHLSSLMCGEHRSQRIKEIKEKLAKAESVRVISTQLVEAGVDFDFPVVYKSFAGLDSIAQAAGRCNREGKLNTGKVVVFVLPRKIPEGILRKSADVTKNMLVGNEDNITGHGAFTHYFERLYSAVNTLDCKDMRGYLTPDQENCAIYFRAASSKFKLIDDSNQKTIIVPYEKGEKLIDQVILQGPSKSILRKLQRYSVTIYDNEFYKLLERGALKEVSDGLYALSTDLDYSKETGLKIGQQQYDVDQFIL
jgi:CRISPR-associated endonuclease/helicase Cas3